MSKVVRIILLVVLVALVGGVVALGVMDLRPQAERTEKVIPDDRLPR